MIVKKIEFTDVFASNCYFFIDEISKHGFIIDPSAYAKKLLKTIEENHWTIEKILLTHTHLDHIGAALELSKILNIQMIGIETSKSYLSDPALTNHFTNFEVIKNITPVKNGDLIALKENPEIFLKIIATPGHTIDSAIYYNPKENIAFTGDTIFQSGIGRTDIEGSGGDYIELMNSIRQKIFTLPEDTVLYPGHGSQTTIREEKLNF